MRLIGILAFCTAMVTTAFGATAAPATAASTFDESVKSFKKTVYYDFNEHSLGGMFIDGEGDWYKADLEATTDKEGILEGAGALKLTFTLKPGLTVRFGKSFEGADLPGLRAARMHVKPMKPGLKAHYYLFADGWKDLRETADQDLKPGVWNEVDINIVKQFPNLNLSNFDCIGLVFSAADGYSDIAYVDDFDIWTQGAFIRDSLRTTVSALAAVKQTVAADVSVDGAQAYGTVKPGIISYNLGSLIHGDPLVSQKLKEVGPGIMRMWGFGDPKRTMNFNPAEGVYQWDFYDREVKYLLSLGWQPMFTIGECQPWNKDPKRYVPADNVKWARMAADMVRHYNVDLKLGIKYWEMWNEHDLGFWGGTEDEYLALLKVAAPAMKKVDSTIIIFAGAWANPAMVKGAGPNMLQVVPPKGVYDGITWHNYLVSNLLPEERILSLTALLEAPAYNARMVLKAAGYDKTMIYGMSEANIDPTNPTDWRQETVLGGIYWASALYHYIQQNVSLATYFTLNGSDQYGAISDVAKPAYQAMLMYSKKASVVGKQWLKTTYDQTKTPTLEVLGLASDKEFSLLVINKDTKGAAFDISLSLANMPAVTRLHAWGITDAHREVTALADVVPAAGKVRLTVPPYSVMVLSGPFASVRALPAVAEAEPTPAALGMPIIGQYTWKGTPAAIVAAKGTVKIDGTLASFAAAPVVSIIADDSARLASGSLTSAKELNADVRMMFDSANFYIAAEVHQDHPATNKAARRNIWDGDCIELYLSSDSKLAYRSRLNKTAADFQIVLAPTSATGKPEMVCPHSIFKNVVIASTATKTGYIITAAIPRSNFPDNDWKAGAKIRFDVAVSGVGPRGNSAHKIFWNALSNAWDAPDEWGIAEFK